MLGLLKRIFAPTESAPPAASVPEPAPAQTLPTAALGREPILDAGQSLVGYRFSHLPGTRARAERQGRTVRHAYAEVLVRSLGSFGVLRQLGRRMAVLELPDSFIDHPCLDALADGHPTVVLKSFADTPAAESLAERVAALRRNGVRIGLDANPLAPHHESLLAEVDLLVFDAATDGPASLAQRIRHLSAAGPGSTIMVRGIAGIDDFTLAGKLGAVLFQGAFVTAREPWKKRSLGPDTARLADLLSRLRRDADPRELADVLKRDGALSVRLLRYVNSAAVGLREPVTSFEHALQLLGRARLERWLTLLMLATDGSSPRSAAVLEAALVRARMMELLADGDDVARRDASFMAGLLSLIDVILEMPLAEALAAFDPPAAIRDALLHGEGHLAQLLALAQACERADGDGLARAAAACGIAPETAGERHAQALAWALEVAE
ncbi:MAG: HDOD domain-containing protein [Rhodocyclaceae bacterium]|nr:HDOD domain-containing protein [Rhodocyclaceae bacterium]